MRVVIDGRPHEVAGGSVLDAIRDAGVHLPALCHDPRLTPSGACRLCLVHIDGAAKAVTSCTTPVRDGMDIVTASADLVASRRALFRMLARRRRARAYRDDSHPYIRVDMSRCVDCWRCVRICDEVQGQRVWHLRGRGTGTAIVPDGPSLRESACVSCGTCVDACPTGALEDRTADVLPPPAQWTRTVCPYCGVGCELEAGTRGDCLVAVRPLLGAPVNKGHLCVKGRYAFSFVSANDRITEPMVREGAQWRTMSWDDAFAVVVERLQQILRQHGAGSVGMLSSARATNEDNYVAQKFARVALGTNNVDCCARVCHAPSAAALKRMVGAGLATGSFDDIERARTILVCGANPTESHPVIGARIRQAARRGARLIVVDPRAIELTADADCHLAIRPGTNVALLNAMAHAIIAGGLCDSAYLAQRVDGVEAFASAVAEWPPERAAAVCGVRAEAIRRAAELYATGAPALTVHGLGVTEHVQGTAGVMALVNLALLTGNIGREGGGVNPLRGQNNVQGAAHMGCDPAVLAGSVALEDGRGRFERHWHAALPAAAGLRLPGMIDAAIAGQLKALWIMGYDLLPTSPDTATTARALAALDFVVVQDLFMTETAREYASVFLPACSSFEKDGTFMNAERRVQRVRAALAPRGASRPDWQVLCDLARLMGRRGFEFADAEAIWDEVRALCDGARGMTYARLDTCGLQWPCPATDHPGTTTLHAEAFGNGVRARLEPVAYVAPPADAGGFPLQLITGRSLYQYNAGTMTRRTPNAALRPTDLLDISPADAGAAAIDDGSLVRVTSEHGTAVLTAHIDAGLEPGRLFATFHRPDIGVNAVIGDWRDEVTGTPAYKTTPVRVERVSGS